MRARFATLCLFAAGAIGFVSGLHFVTVIALGAACHCMWSAVRAIERITGRNDP